MTDFQAKYARNKSDGVVAGGQASKLDGVTDADLDDNHSGDATDLPLTITPNNPRPTSTHAAGWVLDPGID